MTATIKFTGKWKQLAKCIDHKRFHRDVEPRLATILRKAAEMVRDRARSMEGMAPNAPLTAFIKGANTPGVDSGDMKQSIRVVAFDRLSYWTGIRKGDKNFKKAKMVMEGGLIQVTDHMRGLFEMLAWASEGKVDVSALTGRAADLWKRQPGGWKPLSETTTHILIVPRPFLERAYADVEISAGLERQIERIVTEALTRPAKR